MNHLPVFQSSLGLLRSLGYGLVQVALLGAWLTGRMSAWQQGVHGADPAALTPPPAAQ